MNENILLKSVNFIISMSTCHSYTEPTDVEYRNNSLIEKFENSSNDYLTMLNVKEDDPLLILQAIDVFNHNSQKKNANMFFETAFKIIDRGVTHIHIDIIDTSFAKNISFGHEIINKILEKDFKFMIHVMIQNPIF